jgi:hypothetical protein
VRGVVGNEDISALPAGREESMTSFTILSGTAAKEKIGNLPRSNTIRLE